MVCCFQTFLLFVFRRRGTPAWCEVSIALFSHGDEDEDEVGDDDEEQVFPFKLFTVELKLKTIRKHGMRIFTIMLILRRNRAKRWWWLMLEHLNISGSTSAQQQYL